MHMADALLTPAVAGVMYAASAVVAGASIVELHKEEKQDLTYFPSMGVLGADNMFGIGYKPISESEIPNFLSSAWAI